MTSPNIRYFKSMAYWFLAVFCVGFIFTFVHACLEMYTWVWVGLGITVGSAYVSLCAAREMDAQVAITKAIEEGRKEKVDALYGKEDK